MLTSIGDSGKVGQAKELIIGSIIGTAILFSSWIILNTVNPELLNFKAIKSISVYKIGNVNYCSIINGPLKGVITKGGKYIFQESGEEVNDPGQECLDGEQCIMINRWACLKPTLLKCCQYVKNPTTGIHCQTIDSGECPEQVNGNLLDKTYPGSACVQDNNSGRNPCVY